MPDPCYEAIAARKAAHPEVDLVAAKNPMTFEEYSTLFSLSTAEPLGSRVDEFAAHFQNSVQMYSIDFPHWPHFDTARDQLNRVAALIGLPTFETWALLKSFGSADGYMGYARYSLDVYEDLVFKEACAQVWVPHISGNGPYGPALRYWRLNQERFALPGQWGQLDPPPPPPSPPAEPPTLRPATAVDILDFCPICRYVPIVIGETLSILPCEGGHNKHWFHPDCING